MQMFTFKCLQMAVMIQLFFMRKKKNCFYTKIGYSYFLGKGNCFYTKIEHLAAF
jgi:hypothetical protein